MELDADPFGLRRVFWTQTHGALQASSDLGALVSTSPPRLDPLALHGYLCFSHVPAPRTIYADISVLPAGARLTETAAPAALWHEQEGAHGAKEDAVADLRARLRESVSRRLEASGTRDVGVFLSGGLDSSLMAALLTEAGARTQLFTLDFGTPHDGELPCAQAVAAWLNRPLHIVPARARHVAAALEATAACLDQPFGDGVTVPLFLLGAAAAQRVSVVFNGEGGDQLFGGWANKPMLAADVYGDDGLSSYLATFHRFYGLTDALYTSRARAATRDADPVAWLRPALDTERCPTLLHRLRAANLTLKGAQNIAPRAVLLAQAHGLRVEMPFFDKALADWTFTLPASFLQRGACEKYLLKRVADAYLPPEIVWQEKRGMGVPTTEWCLGPLRRLVGHWLSPRRLRQEGWFEPSYVQTLRRGQDSPAEFRTRRLGEKLWTLLLWEVWRETHGNPMP